MSKVYMYFKNRSLYAFTTNKQYRAAFEEERNLEVFKCKTSKMDDEELSELMNNHHESMMIEIPLHDGKRYYTLIGTYKEETEIDITVEKINNTIDDVKRNLSKVPFKNKYKELIDDLTRVSEEVEVNHESHITENLLSLNLFYIFFQLFGDTLSGTKLESSY